MRLGEPVGELDRSSIWRPRVSKQLRCVLEDAARSVESEERGIEARLMFVGIKDSRQKHDVLEAPQERFVDVWTCRVQGLVVRERLPQRAKLVAERFEVTVGKRCVAIFLSTAKDLDVLEVEHAILAQVQPHAEQRLEPIVVPGVLFEHRSWKVPNDRRPRRGIWPD